MEKWEEDAIEKIITEFDFEKVRKTMIALNWVYPFKKEAPTIEELKQIALSHLNDSIGFAHDPEYEDEKTFSSHTAGFRIDYDRKGAIGFSFEIANKHYNRPGYYDEI